MGQWEPLANRIPLDVRRLATQLRRMKDRSGLTVPALAARTGQSAETWSLALAGRRLPPLDAVEVLAQASGADYDRIGALWRLAEKAEAGTGDRGSGKPVPYPDPLDPLGPQEGLPGRRRRFLLLAVVAVLAAAALAGVMLTAGPSDGHAPAFRDAGGPSAPSVAGPDPSSSGSGPVGGTSAVPAATGGPDSPATAPGAPGGAGLPSSGAAPVSPGAGRGGATPGPGGTAAGGGPGGSTSAPSGGGTPGTPATTPATPAPPTTTPPSPTRSGLCLSVIVLGVCVG